MRRTCHSHRNKVKFNREYALKQSEIEWKNIQNIITSQLMRLLQSPAFAFVQSRIHYMCRLLVRKTLQMMETVDDYFNSDNNA